MEWGYTSTRIYAFTACLGQRKIYLRHIFLSCNVTYFLFCTVITLFIHLSPASETAGGHRSRYVVSSQPRENRKKVERVLYPGQRFPDARCYTGIINPCRCCVWRRHLGREVRRRWKSGWKEDFETGTGKIWSNLWRDAEEESWKGYLKKHLWLDSSFCLGLPEEERQENREKNCCINCTCPYLWSVV